VHLVADDARAAVSAAMLIANAHGIRHSTIQVERCGTADVTECYERNEHVDGCSLPPLPSKSGLSLELVRPAASQRHDTPGGCGEQVSPAPGMGALKVRRLQG
jgi:hypothetical protein